MFTILLLLFCFSPLASSLPHSKRYILPSSVNLTLSDVLESWESTASSSLALLTATAFGNKNVENGDQDTSTDTSNSHNLRFLFLLFLLGAIMIGVVLVVRRQYKKTIRNSEHGRYENVELENLTRSYKNV